MLDQNINISNATENTETTSKSAESQQHETGMQIKPILTPANLSCGTKILLSKSKGSTAGYQIACSVLRYCFSSEKLESTDLPGCPKSAQSLHSRKGKKTLIYRPVH